MKIADILRMVANELEGRAQGGAADPRLQNRAELFDISGTPDGQDTVEIVANVEEPHSPNGTTESGNDKEPEDLFLPPLQQKQELLKKAVGVDNVYDDGRPGDEDDREELTPNEEDILDKIKRMAGVPVAAIQELSNDEPLDD